MEGIGYIYRPVNKFEEEVFLALDSDVEDLVSSFVTGLSSFHDEPEHNIEDDRNRVDSLFIGDKNYSLNGWTRNYNWILAFNRLDQQKSPLKNKGENQEPLMAEKKLSCLMDPGPKCFSDSLNKTNIRISEAEGYGESKTFDQQPILAPTHLKMPVLTCDNSTQPKSALKGSHKKVGSGSHPKLHVTWAPDVREPACTSVSHTVGNNCDRNSLRRRERKQHKQLHKGKSSHEDKHRKQGKKHTNKSMYAVEASILRAQYARYARKLHLDAATKRVVF